jgi:hypothetical protein
VLKARIRPLLGTSKIAGNRHNEDHSPAQFGTQFFAYQLSRDAGSMASNPGFMALRAFPWAPDQGLN